MKPSQNVTPKKKTSVCKKAIQKKPRIQKEDDKPSSKEAEEIVQRSRCPTFVKCLRPSQVSGGFWMGFPKKFCIDHLPLAPPGDTNGKPVTLIDDNGKEHKTNYLPYKTGLSGQWKAFSKAHKLVEGDELVFQLIEPCKFKVSIVRLEGSQKTHPTTVSQLPKKRTHQMVVGKEGSEGGSPKRACRIIVDDVEFDSKIPSHIRTRYYQLCTTQGECLHCHVSMTGEQNCKSIVDMITRTVNIADAIQAVDDNTPIGELEKWSETLASFQDHGMSVGFLRVRLSEFFHLHCRILVMSKMYRKESKKRAKLKKRGKKLEANVSDEKMRTNRAKVALLKLELRNLANEPL